jgi:DNA modification methylase
MEYTLHCGDNREVLRTMADASVDSIVCDPPYELGFMGKKWDSTGIAYDVTLWTECLRVLKPGGHLIAFGGSRTYHRLAVAIEDAGFEIRDQIQWIYGSGFPKSLDVSKAMDKQAGATREVVTEKHEDMFGEYDVINSYKVPDAKKVNPHFISSDDNRRYQGDYNKSYYPTTPATDIAKAWHGWGTALKPAHEPAVLARKPLTGTVADNVMTWGCGALNIDGCRVAYDGKAPTGSGSDNNLIYGHRKGNGGNETSPFGRWPANVILDEEATQVLDEQSGHSVSSGNIRHCQGTPSVAKGKEYPRTSHGHSDSGGASRFFYVAKASKAEREAGLDSDGDRANHHPTVKPIELMRYLVRLVTPKGGTVLDPFMGSGSTGCAAMLEGMDFVGIDITPEYLEIARRRILHHANQNPMGL